MTLKRLIAFFFIVLFFSLNVNAQDDIDVGDLSDAEVTEMWTKAQEQGFTIEQFRTLAIARGVPSSKVDVLVDRINTLGTSLETTDINTSNEENPLGIIESESIFGLVGGESIEQVEAKEGDEPAFVVKKSDVFGLDFFNNPNISFAPNLNLATPNNYELGPGDKVVINVWGAAEYNYIKEINREGVIRIEGVGPINISGLTFEDAKDKISRRFKKIYSGISAPSSSPYKINLDISLLSIRTVSVNIIGEVKVPGTYSLSSLSTILNALYAAGGPTRDGTLRNVKLVRQGKEVSNFDVYKYLIEGSQEGNKTVQDQDVLIISPYLSRIQIKGAVKRAGLFELKPNETLSELIKFASGFKSNAFKDRFILERIDGDRRKIKEVLFSNAKNEILKDGDVLEVNRIIEKIENKISIKGPVYRPGNYEYVEGITVLDLIKKASGLKDNIFLNRGLIFSTNDGYNKSSASFSVNDIISGNANIILQPNDEVILYNKNDLTENYTLGIDGAVNKPNIFPFVENITINDLIIMAGGFKDSANHGVIDVFRKVRDDEFETLSKSYKLTSNGTLTIDGNEDFKLEPNDRVSVRYLKGYAEQKKVLVTGEINFPGNYIIEMKNERISDLVERAGGLSPYAFLEGASLIRVNPYFRDVAINSVFDNLNKTEVNSLDINNKKSFKIGIDLEKIIAEGGKESKYNLVLQNGDQLEIPSLKETVKVQGEILAPSLIRFDQSNTLKDYINKSGGFSSRAKRSKTYVIYPNGDIASSKNFLFFRSYPKLKPGAIILVPEKHDARPMTAQEVIGITTGITTFGLLIDRLVR